VDLLELRKENGLTQVDVAKAIGVSLTSYQLWEKGVTTPNEDNLKKLRSFFVIEEE